MGLKDNGSILSPRGSPNTRHCSCNSFTEEDSNLLPRRGPVRWEWTYCRSLVRASPKNWRTLRQKHFGATHRRIFHPPCAVASLQTLPFRAANSSSFISHNVLTSYRHTRDVSSLTQGTCRFTSATALVHWTPILAGAISSHIFILTTPVSTEEIYI